MSKDLFGSLEISSRYSGYTMARPQPGASLLIVCFGDAKRGQLAVEPRAGAREINRMTTLIVEELRHQEPVQIEAAGVASFVVGSKGQARKRLKDRSMTI